MIKDSIIVIGNTGMLGRYVESYFNELNKYHVFGINRKILNFSNLNPYDFLDFVDPCSENFIINCAGVIKPRVAHYGEVETIKINSAFPRMLAEMCKSEPNCRLIHITTDCVFSGKDMGGYNEECNHDVCDLYGKSKSLGEPENCCTIRTSIIGEEVEQSRSLVEWAKSKSGCEVNGFTDHLWNGITCLQFAKVCHQIIDSGSFFSEVRHIFSPDTVSKFDLLSIINDVYNLNLKIKPIKSGNSCYRNLASKFYNSQPYTYFNIPELKQQVQEMKDFDIISRHGQ